MDFRIAKFRGLLGKIIASLTGRSNQLYDLETLTKGKNIRGRRHARSQSVDINQIVGSEGRTQDFDRKFYPLKSHNGGRWLNIALAWQRGVHFPAIDLIKIQDVYIVRDGHHRISVARYLGCKYLDAHVTEWVLGDGGRTSSA
jgi:hypothetical protein